MRYYRTYVNALRQCAKEHENDKTSTAYIIVSDLCEDTAKLLERLEKEPTVYDIINEIEKLKDKIRKEHNYGADAVYGNDMIDGIDLVLEILDEYETRK